MTHARPLALLLLSAAIGAGCAADTGSDIGVAATFDPRPADAGEHDWVVAVSHTDADGEHRLCTGVVVGPYAVITSPACATGAPADSEILVGPDARIADRVSVDGVFVDESEQLAILRSVEPLATTNAELSDASLRDLERARVIGYGASGRIATILGLKRDVEVGVEAGAVVGDEVGLCVGDLGAPIVDDQDRVVGFVTSLSSSCAAPTRAEARSIDSARQLIDAAGEIVPGG